MTDPQFYFLLGSIWVLSGMHRKSYGTISIGLLIMIAAGLSKITI